jgi:hypothetical protein
LRPAQVKIRKTLSWKQAEMVVCACNPRYLGGGDRSIEIQRWSWQKCEILSEKQTESKRNGDVAQVVEHSIQYCVPKSTFMYFVFSFYINML